MPRPDQVDRFQNQPPVHHVVAAVSRKQPARTAVRTGADAVTYRELDLWAGQIAHRVAAAGAGRGDRVGVRVEPSPAMVAAVLGVLRAGAAYVLLDPRAPEDAPEAALSEAGMCCAVSPRGEPGRPGRVAVEPQGAFSVSDRQHGAFPESAPDDPAHLARTVPRGAGGSGHAIVTHAELAAQTAARHALCPGRAVLLLTVPLADNVAATALWATLTAGGRLILASERETRDPEAVARLVERHRVTQLLCTPSLFDDVLEVAEGPGLHRLRTVDTVTLAGEPVPASLVDRHETLLAGTVALVDVDRCATLVAARPRRNGEPGDLSFFGAEGLGRFGRPDAVVRRLALPAVRRPAGPVPAR